MATSVTQKTSVTSSVITIYTDPKIRRGKRKENQRILNKTKDQWERGEKTISESRAKLETKQTRINQ